MEFKEIVSSRYATKSFDGKVIPQSKVNELIELIRFSPSSFNVQPWMIKVISDKETKAKITQAAWNQPQIDSSSHLIVFMANTDVLGNIKKLEDKMAKTSAEKEKLKGMFDIIHSFAQGLDDSQKLSWTQRQVYLAVGNALNGAKSLGFDSCPMEGFDSEALAKILKLPKNLVPTVLVPIGYANDTPRTKIRFEKNEILFN